MRLITKDNVLWFQITMHDVVCMQILHSLHQLSEEWTTLFLAERSFLQDVIEQFASPCTKLASAHSESAERRAQSGERFCTIQAQDRDCFHFQTLR
jgi:hypothetical protein